MKIFKRPAAILCAAIISASALAAAPVTARAAGSLSYSFSGEEKNKAGYAEGTITLSGVSDGKYKLFWADDRQALAGYYPIAEVKVSGGSGSFSLGEHVAIPPDASTLIAVTGDETSVAGAQAVLSIPESKRLKYKSSDANYTFMDYSDIHIDKAHMPYYEHSELHWKKALDTASARKADFIITAGDNVTNAEGPAKEFDRYQEILADSSYSNPVYEGGGNHELKVGDPVDALSAFSSATGLGGDNTDPESKPYYFVEEKKSGDIFIFMALEYLFSPNEGDEFSDEQLDWLSKLLDKYYGKNRNIYLIQHALIKGYGAGDDTEESYYSVPLLQKHKSTQKFIRILEAHPDMIWISGHTHISLEYGYNYSDNNGTSCHMIHDSSVCCPTVLDTENHSLSYIASSGEEYKDFSEGYFVQVFDDEIIFNGENLYHDKIFPASCYIMESCRSIYVDVPREERPEAGTATVTNLLTGRDDGLTSVRITEMPKSTFDCEINDYDLELMKNRSKELLGNLYSYSSYNVYQKLKKLALGQVRYDDAKAEYRDLCDAYLALCRFKTEGMINVYFANTLNWESPRVKLWSSKASNGDGKAMQSVGTNDDGVKLYRIRVNPHIYNQLQFTDGGDSEVSDVMDLGGFKDKIFTVNTNDLEAPYYLFSEDYTAN